MDERIHFDGVLGNLTLLDSVAATMQHLYPGQTKLLTLTVLSGDILGSYI